MSLLGHLRRRACIAVAFWTAMGSIALAETASDTCLAANRGISLGTDLPRVTARLKSGQPLTIVAVGSSSTTGLWLLNPAATYPGVLQRELAAIRPVARLEVINSGRIGDTVSGSLSRFQEDVLAYQPHLVIWQLGTNDAAWAGLADDLEEKITAGVRLLKAAGAEVILMDLQYAPVILASSRHSAIQQIISKTAREERVGLFSRFALMRRSIEAGVPTGALVSWDGLHNSADGYECIGRALARAIVAAGR